MKRLTVECICPECDNEIKVHIGASQAASLMGSLSKTQKLTKEERVARAKKAVNARWKKHDENSNS